MITATVAALESVDSEAEAFAKFDRLIWKVSYDFAVARGLLSELDDLVGAARVFFLHAYRSFDADRNVPLAAWIAMILKRELQHYRRVDRKLPARGLVSTYKRPLNERTTPKVSSDRWATMMADLGDEARRLIAVLIDLPEEDRKRLRVNKFVVRRRFLTTILLKLGWTTVQIVEAYYEIQELVR